MKKTFLAFWAAVLLLTAGSLGLSNVQAAEAPAPGADQDTLTVMTFNLRVANETDRFPWSKRKLAIHEFLKEKQPDLFGTQEGTYQQLRDITSGVAQYDWVGEGREGGSRGEYMAIFYKKDRFDLLEYDHLWLSETPRTVASMSWKTACTRMVTWARFEDKLTHQQFYFVNTHLDHISQEARINGAKLICKTIAGLNKNLPLFLTGDFNIPSTNEEVHGQFVKAGLFDTCDTAQEKRNELYNTFHNFKKPQKGGERIDWIFTRPQLPVLLTEMIVPQEGTVWVSDHMPVISVVKLSK